MRTYFVALGRIDSPHCEGPHFILRLSALCCESPGTMNEAQCVLLAAEPPSSPYPYQWGEPIQFVNPAVVFYVQSCPRRRCRSWGPTNGLFFLENLVRFGIGSSPAACPLPCPVGHAAVWCLIDSIPSADLWVAQWQTPLRRLSSTSESWICFVQETQRKLSSGNTSSQKQFAKVIRKKLAMFHKIYSENIPKTCE